MSKEGLRRASFGLAAVAALSLAACTQRNSTNESTSANAYEPGTVGALEERFRLAGDAQTRYEDCMTQFFPNYRAQVQQYGEVFLGGGDSGMPESPALQGCKTEREEMYRLKNIALGGTE